MYMRSFKINILPKPKSKREQNSNAVSTLKDILPPSLVHTMDLSQEKGASTWLSVLPLEEYGFALHKGAFCDALALCYGWSPANTPLNCACGTHFSVEHVLSCPKGGYPSIRHNESTEPHLQPMTGEVMSGLSANIQDGARLDIAADGFWGRRFERAFFDVKIFNPYAPSNKTSLSACYRSHENEKKRKYDQRIREVEHGSFTPLILSCTGGLGPKATTSYKCLASQLSAKWNQAYSLTIMWLRCHLAYSLLRSSVMCIRGALSHIGHYMSTTQPPLDLVSREALLPAQ